MLKGTTKIELTDVVTGEKQVFEKHNLVTHAMSNIFQPTLGHLTSELALRGYIPAYKGLLGGLLLFESAIQENVSTIYPPSGNKLIGCGRFETTNTTNNTVRGSYNLTESSYDANNKKMKFVYDFNTSQGNGTISSVCLTHADVGYGSYRCDEGATPVTADLCKTCFENPSSTSDCKELRIGQADMSTTVSIGGTNPTTHLFVCDVDNDFAYYFKLIDASNVVICKKPMALKNISLFDNTTLTEVTTLTLNTSIKNNPGYCFDLKDDALYIFSTEGSSNIAVNAKMYITKIAFNTWAVTQYEITNTTGAVLSSTATGAYTTYGRRYCFVHNGYAYFRTNASPYQVYKVSLENPGTFTKLNGDLGANCVPIMAQDGYVYWQYAGDQVSGGRLYLSDATSNTIYKSGVTSVYGLTYTSSSYGRGANLSLVRMRNYPMLAFMTSGSNIERPRFVYFSDYLATINNLGTPITKVNTQTMKITYTIQES